MSDIDCRRVTIDITDPVPQLRMFVESDLTDKNTYPTLLLFYRTPEYIVVRVNLPRNISTVVGIYKDLVFEWSSRTVFTMDVHVEIACMMTAWCEEANHHRVTLRDDISIYRSEDVGGKPQVPHYVTPGGLHNRFTEALYSSTFNTLRRPNSWKLKAAELSAEIVQSTLGVLAGGCPALPRFKLVVDQSKADVVMQQLAGGDYFKNGDVLSVNATTMLRRTHQFAQEVTKQLEDEQNTKRRIEKSS